MGSADFEEDNRLTTCCSKHLSGDGTHTCTKCLRPTTCAEYFGNDHGAADQSFPLGSTPMRADDDAEDEHPAIGAETALEEIPVGV